MRTACAIAAFALIQATSLAAPALAGGAQSAHPRPPESYQGQWYTTPGKCSYSRAQAPGYPVQWVLILNPHHIGQPNAHAGCPARL